MEITATGILSSGQPATPRAILTFPTVMALADGSLALSIETNKHYHDASPWMQKVVFFHSSDRGQTWGSRSWRVKTRQAAYSTGIYAVALLLGCFSLVHKRDCSGESPIRL